MADGGPPALKMCTVCKPAKGCNTHPSTASPSGITRTTQCAQQGPVQNPPDEVPNQVPPQNPPVQVPDPVLHKVVGYFMLIFYIYVFVLFTLCYPSYLFFV